MGRKCCAHTGSHHSLYDSDKENGITSMLKSPENQSAAWQQNTNLRDRLNSACHHKQNWHKLQDQIHLNIKFKGSVMESENSPFLPYIQSHPAGTSSEQPQAILDLGQHYILWDSICPFLCDGFLLFYSTLLKIFQQSHFSWACLHLLYVNIVPAQYKWKCFSCTELLYRDINSYLHYPFKESFNPAVVLGS